MSTEPVPSRLPATFLGNVELLDAAVNAPALTFTDRFGIERLTWAGIVSLLSGTLGLVAKATKADLDADLAWRAGTVGWVLNDSTAANNVVYRKTGGVGAGAWVAASDSLLSSIQTSLAAVVAKTVPLGTSGTAAGVRSALGFNSRVHYLFRTGASTANAIVANPSTVAISALTGDELFVFDADLANTTTTPTLNISGLGAKLIRRQDGSAVAANEWLPGTHLLLKYRVSADEFRIVFNSEPSLPTRSRLTALESAVGTSGTPAGARAMLGINSLIHYLFRTGATTSDAIVANPANVAISALNLDHLFLIDLLDTNTTTTPTLNISGIGPRQICRGDGSPVAVNEWEPNSHLLLKYSVASNHFRIVLQRAAAPTPETGELLVPLTITGGTSAAIIAAPRSGVTLKAGGVDSLYRLIANADAPGPVSLVITGLNTGDPRNIQHPVTNDLLSPGAWKAGDVLLISFNANTGLFVLHSPAEATPSALGINAFDLRNAADAAARFSQQAFEAS